MKILAVSDLHCQPPTGDLDAVARAAAAGREAPRDDIDVVVDAGDYSVFGRGGEEWLRWLDEGARRGRIAIMVGGNHEVAPHVQTETRRAFPHIRHLSLMPECVGAWDDRDVRIVGCDSYQLYEQEMMLGSCCSRAERDAILGGHADRFAQRVAALPRVRETILVSHYPPTRFRRTGAHRRQDPSMYPSTCALAERLVRALGIRVCIHGHYHTRGGEPEETNVDGLRMINPGPGGFVLAI